MQETLLTVADDATEFLTTRELASLLRLKERKVYDLAASGEIPCTRATGKLLFPREAIRAWLATHHSGPVNVDSTSLPSVFLGSHDPLLDWAIQDSQCGIPTLFDSSLEGLDRFLAHQGLVCGLHIPNEKAGWNTEHVGARCALTPVVLIEWAKRRRGLIYNHNKTARPSSLAQLAGNTVTPRQQGAGAQTLLLNLLRQSGIDSGAINWGEPVRTESDAVLSVLEGKSHFTFGLQSFAEQYQLSFEPLVEERFDLLMHRRSYFEPPIQKLLHFCHSDRFKIRAKELSGYDVSSWGEVHFNGV